MKKIQSLYESIINSSWLLGAIIVAGIVLRVSGLTSSAIWYDEALPLETAKLSFLSMLDATKYTFSPPLWATIVWLSTKLFGTNEFAIRFPALLFGISTLWIAYRIAKEFQLSHHQILASMILIAWMPYQLALAQDGRMYTLLTALILIAAWAAIKDNWIWLSISASLLLYTHYTAPFYLVAIYLMALFNGKIDIRRFRNVFISGIAAIISFLPWLPNYLETLKIDSLINPVTFPEIVLMVYRITFEDTLTNYPALLILSMVTVNLLLMLSLVTSIWALLTKPEWMRSASDSLEADSTPKRYLQLTMLAVIPFAAMLTWNILWTDFLYYRLIAAMLIPVTIWAVRTLSNIRFTRVITNLSFASVLLLVGVGVMSWSPHSKSGTLRETAEFIESQWQEGDIIYHITGTTYLPASQYFEGKPQYLINETQHEWLLPLQLQEIFKISRAPMEEIEFKRAWVFYSRGNLIIDEVAAKADKYTLDGILVTTVKGWRFATMEVYLVEAESFQK